MLASPYHQITASNAIRGILLWILTACTVFYIINGLATRPLPVPVEHYRQEGMSDEHVLSIALQRAIDKRSNSWWINDHDVYLVFDSTRDYRISQAMYAAYDIRMSEDARSEKIAILPSDRKRVAGMRP